MFILLFRINFVNKLKINKMITHPSSKMVILSILLILTIAVSIMLIWIGYKIGYIFLSIAGFIIVKHYEETQKHKNI